MIGLRLALLVVLVGICSTFVSRSNEIHFLNALAAVAIVVAIYVFVGNSGVLSFGQISFVAVGAFADPDFPAPAVSVWEERKHSWVVVPEDAEHIY